MTSWIVFAERNIYGRMIMCLFACKIILESETTVSESKLYSRILYAAPKCYISFKKMKLCTLIIVYIIEDTPYFQ